ncbi:autotransporter outer membrane beta-barrel domain-containing protein [Orbus sturtevantii]|uniref:autotransporter outer membrane beta-barrel domain-containing protein n=1 Tax=Orbus sturtevantii TaxID=3074109 RepID=UPI00370D9504
MMKLKKTIILLFVTSLTPLYGQANIVEGNIVLKNNETAYSVVGAETDWHDDFGKATGTVSVNDSASVTQFIYGSEASSRLESTATGSVYLNDNASALTGVNAYEIAGAYAVVRYNSSYSAVLTASAIGNVYQNNNSKSSSSTGAVISVFSRHQNQIINGSAIGNVYLNNTLAPDEADDSFFAAVIGARAGATEQDGLPVNDKAYLKAKGNVYLSKNASASHINGAEVMARAYSGSTLIAEGNVYLKDNARVTYDIHGVMIGDNVLYPVDNVNATVTALGNVYLDGNIKLQKISYDGNLEYLTEIFGSYFINEPKYYQIFNGNTFTMGANPVTVYGLGNFEHYNFYLNDYNKDAIKNSIALVTVTGRIENDNTVANKNGVAVTTTNKSNIKIAGISGEGITKVGDTITLIDASYRDKWDNGVTFTGGDNTDNIAGLFNAPNNNTVDVGLVGKADISYTINTDNTITASIDDIRIDNHNLTAKVKPLAEGRLGGLQNTTRGADLLLSSFDDKSPPTAGSFTPIAVLDGGMSKYHSGSHIDSRDYRIMIGSRYQMYDNLAAGLTVEYGRSNYDTYNQFGSTTVNGDGHSDSYGFSLFGKYVYTLPVGQIYSDAALRFGRTSTEFNSGDIITGGGSAAYYKSKVNYIGGIIGGGYVYPVNEISSFDSSIHYFYTRLGSDSVVVDGDKVNFDKSISSRIQLKEQYNHQASDVMTLSLAGIYEYEFDSDAKTNVSGISIDAPSVKGSTGIMELGIKSTPLADNRNFSINLNARGYFGKRDGASVSALVEYNF